MDEVWNMKLYRTTQIDLKAGEALRITVGRRTVCVYANKRGLHFSKGGYARRKRNKLS